MPTPLQREETEYFHNSRLDDLHAPPEQYSARVQELKRADTEYEFDQISTQGLEQLAEIERQAITKTNPTPLQELKRADTEYEFDQISTQGLEQLAEIERKATAKMGNTEATLRSLLQDGAAEMREDEGNTEVIERSEEGMDVEERIIIYLKPVWNYSHLNFKVLSAISLGKVACIRGHFESRSAAWSAKTCFAELGIKPEFQVALDDGVSRIISLPFYDSKNIQKWQLYG